MPDPGDDASAFDPPDADLTYRNHLRTCEMLGVEPVTRERALGLIQEWSEVLSGRPEPTTHYLDAAIGTTDVRSSLTAGARSTRSGVDWSAWEHRSGGGDGYLHH